MARYLLIGLWIAHAVVVAREDGDRWLALTPPNGLPPPALELLSPAAGTVLRRSDGPELTLQLGLNVAVWCSDRNGSLNETNAGSMASGSEAAAALIEAESEWTCAKLSDMVLCLDAVSVTSSSTPPPAARAPDSSDGEALQTIARQRCLPWDVAAVHSTIPTAHLPTGAFDLVARLIWAPFVELYEEDESDLASIANGNTSQSDREISNAVNKHRRNSNIVVNRDGTFEVHSGRSSRDAKARSSKSSDSSQVDSSNDGSCSSKNSKSLPGGVAVAKWESFSAPIAMNREAGWSTGAYICTYFKLEQQTPPPLAAIFASCCLIMSLCLTFLPLRSNSYFTANLTRLPLHRLSFVHYHIISVLGAQMRRPRSRNCFPWTTLATPKKTTAQKVVLQAAVLAAASLALAIV